MTGRTCDDPLCVLPRDHGEGCRWAPPGSAPRGWRRHMDALRRELVTPPPGGDAVDAAIASAIAECEALVAALRGEPATVAPALPVPVSAPGAPLDDRLRSLAAGVSFLAPVNPSVEAMRDLAREILLAQQAGGAVPGGPVLASTCACGHDDGDHYRLCAHDCGDCEADIARLEEVTHD